MSYSVWLEGEDVDEDEASLGSITWNVSPMIRYAFSQVQGLRTRRDSDLRERERTRAQEGVLAITHIPDLQDKRAGDVLEILEQALKHLRDPDNETTYQEMNPENGWGSHRGTIKTDTR